MSDNESEHYNPLLVTVLPKERRARHPYQLCAMAMLFTLGLWQLAIDTVPTSTVNDLDKDAFVLLNWLCIVGGAAGVLAAFIPERIVRWKLRIAKHVFRYEFDATYFRLWDELGCHLMLFTLWASYGLVVWSGYGFVKGYSFGLASALWFGIAAVWRAGEVLHTLRQAGVFSRTATAIIGLDDMAKP